MFQHGLTEALCDTAMHLSGCEKQCGLPTGVTHLVADPSGRFVAAGSRP